MLSLIVEDKPTMGDCQGSHARTDIPEPYLLAQAMLCALISMPRARLLCNSLEDALPCSSSLPFPTGSHQQAMPRGILQDVYNPLPGLTAPGTRSEHLPLRKM